MKIIRHPDKKEEELANAAIEEVATENDQQGLEQTLKDLPGWARVATDHDNEFWQQQRTSVWSRIAVAENRSAHRAPVLAFALAAALIAVAGWLLERPLLEQPMTAPPSREAYVDPDHELLVEVERMVQIDGPLALEPAALLAQEMVQDLPAREYPIRKKEPRNEN